MLENRYTLALDRPLGQFAHGSEGRCFCQFFGAQTARL
jgi:hypothetical protein